MKKIVTHIVLCSICCLNSLSPSVTGDGWIDADGQVDFKQEEKNKEQKNMEPSVTGDLSSVLTRALSSDPVGSSKDAKGVNVLAKNQVRFTKSAYASGVQGNVLYLGAENLGAGKALGTDKKNFALSRAILGVNSSGALAPMIQSLAPSKVTINGEKDQDNPLVRLGTNVTHLTLQNRALPVLTAQARDDMNMLIEATEVFVVTDPMNGTTLLKNANPIKDAATPGVEINKSIVAIAASNQSTQEIFAVVPAAGKAFEAADGDDRGIAVLRRAVDDLTVLNDKATKIDVKAYDLSTNLKDVKFSFFDHGDAGADAITKAKLGNTAAMFWDDTFQRLFIGLEAKRDAVNKAGGVLNLAVGRLIKDPAVPAATTADVLEISPIVENPTKALFYDGANANTSNVIDKVVGFYFDSNDNPGIGATISTGVEASLATDIIRSMHTTTGKDYLIIAGRFSANGADFTKEIYAIPLLGNAVNADNKNPQRVGTLAKSNFSGAPTAIGEMPGKGQDSVLVGGRSFENSVNIADLFVSGDSVYLCMAGRDGIAVDDSGDVGLFQSTALFDANGTIHAWTPFTRVMGSMERVFGAGLDNRTGEYLFVTETNDAKPALPFFDPAQPNIFANNISTVRLSGWGKTDSVNNLGTVLENLFPQSSGGVHELITFDKNTPGFDPDHLSILLAVGLDRVALIQSGKFTPADQIFYPETVFTTSGLKQNIFVFNDPALRDVGPICSADFARSVDANEGWLFVGGYDGIAVLRKADGTGFDSSGDGLKVLNDPLIVNPFPVAPTYSFKKLNPSNADSRLDHVRKITCLNRVLYILTEDNVYAVDFAANKFRNDPGSAALGEVALDLTGVPAGAALLDFIVLAGKYGANTFKALLATTKGLFTITYAAGNYVTQEVKVGGKSLGPVIQMQYLSSTKGALSVFGNLYVIAADIAKNPTETKVYRFVVNAGIVLPIPSNNVTPAGLVVDLGEFRSNIFADGSTILHTRGRHFGDTNYLAAVPITDFKSSIPLTPRLALTTDNSYIGGVVRDSASGALYVPGDWGVRANL